jgi:DNA-binding phage protein
MQYPAKLSREGKFWLATFPGCPGCQTDAFSKADVLKNAREALEGWLESHLVAGDIPPRPTNHRGTPITISPNLAVILQLRWARSEKGLSQAAVAKRAGVTQQAIAKLEHPDGNPTLATLEKVAAAFGLRLDVQLNAA